MHVSRSNDAEYKNNERYKNGKARLKRSDKIDGCTDQYITKQANEHNSKI